VKQDHIWGVLKEELFTFGGVVGERYVVEDVVDVREEVVVGEIVAGIRVGEWASSRT
jgi:hypothetical protein